MRTVVVDRYGPPDVARVTQSPVPSPRPGEILVRVEAVAVTSADARIRAARFPSGFGPFARLAFGIGRPRRTVLGSAFSGVVETSTVAGHTPGDAVCGMTGIRMGAHAEYVAVPATRVVPVPAEVTHTDAAAILFGGTTALYFLRDRAGVKPGDAVLVVGASGAIGTNAVQLAKHLGARVTAVTSAANADLVADLGADRVIDYRSHDVTELPDRYDAVFDTVGTLRPATGRRLLTDDGVLLLAVAGLWDTVRPLRRVKTGTSPESPVNFEYLLALAAAGHLRAVTEELGGLDDVVTAYRRVDSGRKVGNVVLRPRR